MRSGAVTTDADAVTFSHPELLAPTRRTRTTDVVRNHVNAGRPLPLTVLLDSMCRYYDEALRLEDPTNTDHDPHAAKLCRMAAVAVAEKAAPYVHPKFASVTLRPEDEEEAAERRSLQRLTAESLQGKTVAELGRMYLAVVKGEDVDVKGEADQTPSPTVANDSTAP